MKKNILIIILGILLCAGVYGAYEYAMGGRCNPNGKCKACTNCNYCKNCSKNKGTCSVCR
ncbi:hypothetical protein ACQ1Q1_10415 [Ornithobacterium rhinotracheale]|uniref:Uncharacterized protein n=1 Tax=Ornithobacterium rhinotracheale (strain ATCC 51463 / DSM 15997 / CCUG 23171 / CIP 104009 / LMG 9086) TaxID=867902 RepID=I3ZZY2_ORNRL|nr:hypothetical protein [Ornithobacterium rhinotracheale]AFL97266.1 hypothetical protein Ornrh_1075 [Ornithobacterium rhinotracheale DSM 15997]AIP99330.1 hypothetical protein Q785_05980 [Ornithobacterium rhinotracheale ORT-UMN 88]KGB66623.1 hypothetical protein Q787_06135 [Ornithobacterium rhinotracheale H06-030791]MCK0194158.1 hypothetical protein [Ornithobacterium rhinotracheale]MCK0203738.1 hypothetical protein [Ornithobacterium rhinotracheale]